MHIILYSHVPIPVQLGMRYACIHTIHTENSCVLCLCQFTHMDRNVFCVVTELSNSIIQVQCVACACMSGSVPVALNAMLMHRRFCLHCVY